MVLRAPITFLFIGLILLTFFQVRLPAPTTFHTILDASFYLFDKVNALVTRLVIALTQLIFQPIRLLSLPFSLPTPAISANGNLRKFSLLMLNLALLLIRFIQIFCSFERHWRCSACWRCYFCPSSRMFAPSRSILLVDCRNNQDLGSSSMVTLDR